MGKIHFGNVEDEAAHIDTNKGMGGSGCGQET
jgi:hypothetical protein